MDTVDLSNINLTGGDLTFSYNVCYRSGNITNLSGPSGQQIYLSSTIYDFDKTSSPVMVNPDALYAPKNLDFSQLIFSTILMVTHYHMR